MVRRSNQMHLDELLSAYLDGELSPRAQEDLEARLASDSALQEQLDELRHTVGLLQSMPQEEVPRNFLLTPAMVTPDRVERRAETSLRGLFAGRWAAPVLTFTTALSAFLCAFALLANLSLNHSGGLYFTSDDEPLFQVAMEEPVEGEAAAPEAAVPEAPADMLDALEREETGEGAPEDDGGNDYRAADADVTTPVTDTDVMTPVVAPPILALEGLSVTVAPGDGMGGGPPVSTTVAPTSEPALGAPPEEIAEIGDTVPDPAPGQDEWEARSAPPPTAEAAIEQPAGVGLMWVLIGGLGLLTGSLIIVTVLAWRARGR